MVGEVPISVRFRHLYELAESRVLTVAEMWQLGWGDGGEAWKWKRSVRSWGEDLLGECCVMLHNVVLQVTVKDRWQWLLDPVKGYTITKVYNYLIFSDGPTDEERFMEIWHKQVPLKVSLLMWRGILLHANNLCVGGCDLEEIATHLFLHCLQFGSIGSLIRQWIEVSLVYPSCLVAHFFRFRQLCSFSKVLWSYLHLICFATF